MSNILMDELQPGDVIWLNKQKLTVRTARVAGGKIHLSFDRGPDYSAALNLRIEADLVSRAR